MVTAPDPGWYDDGTGKQRWWDGIRWTDQYVDLRDTTTQLRTDAGRASSASANPGWYDDGRGRQRWWDGARWTTATRFSGSEEQFAGVVVDGRWIHFGDLSEPIGGARATVHPGADLVKRGTLSRPAVARTLFGPAGAITPRLLPRALDRALSYLVVEVTELTWLAPVPAGRETDAARFAAWINSSADHYRYG